MHNVAKLLNYVVKKVQDSQEKFITIIKSLSEQIACRLPKSIDTKCRDNLKLYHDIQCKEGRKGCRDILKLCCDPVKVEEKEECREFSKLCCAKGQGKWQENIVPTSKIIS